MDALASAVSENRGNRTTSLEGGLPISPASKHGSRESGDRAGPQQAESHDAFKRSDDFCKTRIERNQLVFGDIDAVAREYLVVGITSSTLRDAVPVNWKDSIATLRVTPGPSNPDPLGRHLIKTVDL